MKEGKRRYNDQFAVIKARVWRSPVRRDDDESQGRRSAKNVPLSGNSPFQKVLVIKMTFPSLAKAVTMSLFDAT